MRRNLDFMMRQSPEMDFDRLMDMLGQKPDPRDQRGIPRPFIPGMGNAPSGLIGFKPGQVSPIGQEMGVGRGMGNVFTKPALIPQGGGRPVRDAMLRPEDIQEDLIGFAGDAAPNPRKNVRRKMPSVGFGYGRKTPWHFDPVRELKNTQEMPSMDNKKRILY